MKWGDDLLGPEIRIGGALVSPRRKALNFVSGVTAQDNPQTGRTDLVIEGAGRGGSIAPLSNVLFVDGATSVAAEDQDGSAGSPYGTIAAAIAAGWNDEGPLTVLITPGAYGEATIDVFYPDAEGNPHLVLQALGGHRSVAIPALACDFPGKVTLIGLSLQGVTCSGSGEALELTLRDCYTGSAIAGPQTVIAIDCYLEAETYDVGAVADFHDCKIFMAPIVTFTSPGVLTLDAASNYAWVAAGGSIVNGTLVVTANATPIANDAVTNAKLADVATATIKGRTAAGTGDPEDLTGTQVTALLDVFSSALKGLTPASGGGTANFLRADGTWAAPAGGGSGGLYPRQALSGASNSLNDLTYGSRTLAVSHGSATTLTIPPDATLNYPVGTLVHVYQAGAGQLTIVATAPATLVTPESAKLRKQYSMAVLVKLAANEWMITGDLELA